MKIQEVSGRAILNSRKEKTILVSIKTNLGVFSASAPSGKSTGKFEVKSYVKNLEGDIKKLDELSDYFSEEDFEKFDDLIKTEEILDKHVGGNTIFAVESAVLKAMAKEKKCEVWQLINEKAYHIPRLVGNVIGGGKHSEEKKKKPDFQEFLLIPKTKTIKQAFEINKKAKAEAKIILKKIEEEFTEEENSENAWITQLNEKIVLDILYRLKQKFDLEIGVDIAASSFYKRKNYNYENPKLKRTGEEQFSYISNLIKNYEIFYVEDVFQEEDFEDFSKILKKFSDRLIVGDDLTVTSPKRLEKAIKEKSINGIIIKPNQIGSLIKVKQVCEIARKNKIKLVFSHRSGETEEDILADLAFGFEADFFKCGIDGKERESKIKRLIEIERKLG